MSAQESPSSGDRCPLSPRERAGVRGKVTCLSERSLKVFSYTPFPLIPAFSLGEKGITFPALVSACRRKRAQPFQIYA